MSLLSVDHYFCLTCLFGIFVTVELGSNGRFPLAYRGTKGWFTLEQGSNNESSINFQFSSFQSNDTEIDWSITSTPFIYGEESCDDVLNRVNANITVQGTLKMDPGTSGGAWKGTISLKGYSSSSLQGHSVLLRQKTSSKALVCVNILSDDVTVFESRFYGPQVAGSVYFFLDTTTKILKVYNRLSNGNNLDPAVKWTLKNKWWIPDVDFREPGWPSCRESGDKADTSYTPPAHSSSLQPETVQLLEITDFTLSADALVSSVIVLTRQDTESWQKDNNVLGCGRIRRSDGWSAQVKNKEDEIHVYFKQRTLFHPLLVEFKMSLAPKITTLKLRDSENGTLSQVFYSPSNSTTQSTDRGQHSSVPTYTVHRTMAINDGEACDQTAKERVDLLLNDNAVRVESDEHDDQNVLYSAYFTDAALESWKNNVLMKTIRVQWRNKELCAMVTPDQERSTFAQASFYYPFAGTALFAQPKSRPESTTIVAVQLQHQFDDKPSTNVKWAIVVRNVEPTLNDMSCSMDRDFYDPVMMKTDLCRKSNLTCAIGDLFSQLGGITISGYGGEWANVAVVSHTMPLGGPYTIVGQTLKVDASWVKGCANVSKIQSWSVFNNELCSVQQGENDTQATTYHGAVATFKNAGDINGTIFMYRPNTEAALPADATTLCNNLKLPDDGKGNKYIFELLDHSNGSDLQAACHNSTAGLFNPLFLDMNKKGYDAACETSESLCAIGDLTHRMQDIPFDECSCVNALPVTGPFGVSGLLLRVRRGDTKQVIACAPFEPWQGTPTDVYAGDTVTRHQLVNAVAEEFHLHRTQVQVSKSANQADPSKHTGCSVYGIAIFDPRSASISSILATNQSVLVKRWSLLDPCTAGAVSVSRFSLLQTLLASSLVIISIKLL